jgi:hypothetical protein
MWLVLFSLSLLTLTGFIVPNVGALIRYRSLALPFLAAALLYHCRPELTAKVQQFLKRG